MPISLIFWLSLYAYLFNLMLCKLFSPIESKEENPWSLIWLLKVFWLYWDDSLNCCENLSIIISSSKSDDAERNTCKGNLFSLLAYFAFYFLLDSSSSSIFASFMCFEFFNLQSPVFSKMVLFTGDSCLLLSSLWFRVFRISYWSLSSVALATYVLLTSKGFSFLVSYWLMNWELVWKLFV